MRCSVQNLLGKCCEHQIKSVILQNNPKTDCEKSAVADYCSRFVMYKTFNF